MERLVAEPQDLRATIERAIQDVLKQEVRALGDQLARTLREEWQGCCSQGCCGGGGGGDRRGGSKGAPAEARPAAAARAVCPEEVWRCPQQPQGCADKCGDILEFDLPHPHTPPPLARQAPAPPGLPKSAGVSNDGGAGGGGGRPVDAGGAEGHGSPTVSAGPVHGVVQVGSVRVASMPRAWEETSPGKEKPCQVPTPTTVSPVGAWSGGDDDDEEDGCSLDGSLSSPTRVPDTMPPSSQLQQIVSSNLFDYVICTCVITNSILIGVQSQYSIALIFAGSALRNPIEFQVAETFFLAIFFAELVIRMMCYGCKFFTMSDWKWNIFDTTIVTLHLVDFTLGQALGDSQPDMPANVNFMRILRILRLVRIIRLIRVLRYFQELRTMVSSIASSLKSLLWTIILVALLIYVVGVYFTNLIVDHAEINPDFLKREDVQRYYSSLLGSTLSLFQAMTGGVDWDDLLRPLTEEISPLLAVIFSLYITFSVLCMMNVITGVFVEGALMTARGDKDRDVKRQIEAAFNCTDTDGSGQISWEEFGDALTDPKVVECLKAIEIEPSEAKGLFALLDADGSGDIDKDEFIIGCLRLRGQARAIDLATLTYFNKRVSSLWVKLIEDIQVALSAMQACGAPGLSEKVPPSQWQSTASVASATRIQPNEFNLCATWADLQAEGDRRVAKAIKENKTRKTLVDKPTEIKALDDVPTTPSRSNSRRSSI